MRCSLNPKTQAVNKSQRQLRPERYFPIFFKSRAQNLLISILNTNFDLYFQDGLRCFVIILSINYSFHLVFLETLFIVSFFDISKLPEDIFITICENGLTLIFHFDWISWFSLLIGEIKLINEVAAVWPVHLHFL